MLENTLVKKVVSAATTNSTLVKGTPGFINSVNIYNSAAYAVFVKLYNQVLAPVVGTDVPYITVGIPAGGSVNLFSEEGRVYFSNGIALAVTKLSADTDTTVIAVGDAIVNLFYN